MTGLINYAVLELLLSLLKRDWTLNPNRLPALYTCSFLTFILCRTKEAALIWVHSRMTHKQEEGREEQWEETLSEQEKFLEGELRSAEGKFGGDLRLGSSPGIVLSTSEKFRDPSVTHLATILLLTKRQQSRF